MAIEPENKSSDDLSKGLKALEDFLANVSVNATETGMNRPIHPERMEQIFQAAEKQKREEDKKFNALLAQLQTARNVLEEELGGLDNMGASLGIERKANETDDEYRTRLKDEIMAQIAAGTLVDPTGKLTEWAYKQEEIEKEMAMEAKQVSSLEAAAPEDMKRDIQTIEMDTVFAAVSSNAKEVTTSAGIEGAKRYNKGELSQTDTSLDKATKNSISDNFRDKMLSPSVGLSKIARSFNENANLTGSENNLMADASLMGDTPLLNQTETPKFTI